MTKTNINILSKYFLLSGERLEKAKRVYRQDIVLVLAGSLLTALLAQYYPDVQLIIWGLFTLIALVWTMVRIARGETFYQFRLKEAKNSKMQSNEALKELHEFAASVEKTGNDKK